MQAIRARLSVQICDGSLLNDWIMVTPTDALFDLTPEKFGRLEVELGDAVALAVRSPARPGRMSDR